MRIYKYPLEITDEQTLNLPVSGYEILSAQVQGDTPLLYIKVPNEPSEQTIPLKIYIHGTGHSMHPRATKYLGTVSTHQGSLWWHIFCERNREALPA